MGRKPQHVTDAELAVLQALWDRGPATIRQLTDALYPGGSASHYATVKKLLERLEAKHFVHRDRSEPVHRFGAAVDRDDLIDQRLKDVAETLCEGRLTPLLTHLVRTQKLSQDERQALRALIDRLDSGPRRREAP